MKLLSAFFASATLILFSNVAVAQDLTFNATKKVCLEGIGLRSDSTGLFAGGAGYGMDDGTTPSECLSHVGSSTWKAHLDNTLKVIVESSDAVGRYLVIGEECRGLSDRYRGSFPKCNRVSGPNTVIAHHQITRADTRDIQNLRTFVIEALNVYAR